jgi:exonuclease III
VRIATWNVNSAKQRMPRMLPWLDQRRPDVVCLQETKLADEAFAALLGEELASRGYEVAAHGEPQWNGVAILSRVGLDDVGRGPRRRAGLPASGGARGGRDLWRDPGRLGVRAERAGPRTPSTTTTSSRGCPRCGTSSPPARRRRSSAAT